MIKSILGSVAGVAALFLVLDVALATPDVMVSYETNTCVEVVNYGSILFGETDYSCENMPERYNHFWVQ
jgi:hypothetical protein